ncbi:glycosyltransferase [Alkalihalobacillus sp. AL-G]|uniref:glycosyltransferase n=1 Tax=Alkalihalobacillus sp. AL-G TaxID=2926399 RepID=UPI0027299C29|nr:glycosyltransferase [Alkalihalobacillus sp. AL-G]WLD93013.1 glycosyltransferase [Alkalihalobacillus sp. AL-G]
MYENNIKVSVCVLTYNHEKYIKEALDSILEQDVDFKYEIVIGDDCSTDRTKELILQYKKRYPNIIKPILRDENVGILRNFNEVLQKCSGMYIAHLDGDDRMLPLKLQKQVKFLDENPGFALCCHNVRVFDSETNQTLYFFNEKFKLDVGTIDDLVKHGTYFAHCSKMFRRSAVGEGLNPNNHFIIDWLFHIENARHGKIGYIDDVLGEYRKHSYGITSFKKEKKKLVFNEQIYTLNVARKYVSDETVKQGFAKLYYSQAWYYLNNNMYDDFRDAIKKSIDLGSIRGYQHLILYYFRNVPRLLFAIRRLKKFVSMYK